MWTPETNTILYATYIFKNIFLKKKTETRSSKIRFKKKNPEAVKDELSQTLRVEQCFKPRLSDSKTLLRRDFCELGFQNLQKHF